MSQIISFVLLKIHRYVKFYYNLYITVTKELKIQLAEVKDYCFSLNEMAPTNSKLKNHF